MVNKRCRYYVKFLRQWTISEISGFPEFFKENPGNLAELRIHILLRYVYCLILNFMLMFQSGSVIFVLVNRTLRQNNPVKIFF